MSMLLTTKYNCHDAKSRTYSRGPLLIPSVRQATEGCCRAAGQVSWCSLILAAIRGANHVLMCTYGCDRRWQSIDLAVMLLGAPRGALLPGLAGGRTWLLSHRGARARIHSSKHTAGEHQAGRITAPID